MGSAHAVLINISNTGVGGSLVNGVAFGDIPGGGSPSNLHAYLSNTIIPGYNDIVSPIPPIMAPDVNTGVEFTGGSVANPIDLSGFDYASVHYGGGPGGGMHVFYHITGNVGGYMFAQSGSGVGDGTGTGTTFGGGRNKKYVGTGGISNVRLWGNSNVSVPDSGSALLLLSIGLGLISLFHRKRAK